MSNDPDRPAWDKGPWWDSDDPRRVGWGFFRHGAGAVIAVVVLVLALSAGIWGLTVAFSGTKGAGDVVRKNNDANNRIFSQQHFEDLYAAVVSEDQQLDIFAGKTDDYSTTTFAGIQAECIRDRNQYNADANKVLEKDWLSSDLPHQIDPASPATDCKPSK